MEEQRPLLLHARLALVAGVADADVGIGGVVAALAGKAAATPAADAAAIDRVGAAVGVAGTPAPRRQAAGALATRLPGATVAVAAARTAQDRLALAAAALSAADTAQLAAALLAAGAAVGLAGAPGGGVADAGVGSGLQPSQEKQQVPPQQASPWAALGQQSVLLVHPLAPVGRRQVPWQHVCPTQQSLSPLHFAPNGALQLPSLQQTCGPGQVGHLQCPCAVQVAPGGHVPQLPPQPSGPHWLPWQCGTQTHWPF